MFLDAVSNSKEQLSQSLQPGLNVTIPSDQLFSILEYVSTPRPLPTKTIRDGLAISYDGFLDCESANKAWSELLPHIPKTGRRSQKPKKFTWFSDSGVNYGWKQKGGEVVLEPVPLPSALVEILDLVSVSFGVKFNGCLAVYYSEGDHNLGLHQDTEAVNDPEAPIFSLSLGAPRAVVFHSSHVHVPETFVNSVVVTNGHGLLMTPECNRKLWHGVEKSKLYEGTGARLVLSFRKVLLPGENASPDRGIPGPAALFSTPRPRPSSPRLSHTAASTPMFAIQIASSEDSFTTPEEGPLTLAGLSPVETDNNPPTPNATAPPPPTVVPELVSPCPTSPASGTKSFLTRVSNLFRRAESPEPEPEPEPLPVPSPPCKPATETAVPSVSESQTQSEPPAQWVTTLQSGKNFFL